VRLQALHTTIFSREPAIFSREPGIFSGEPTLLSVKPTIVSGLEEAQEAQEGGEKVHILLRNLLPCPCSCHCLGPIQPNTEVVLLDSWSRDRRISHIFTLTLLRSNSFR
jgi:hypothetical protein